MLLQKRAVWTLGGGTWGIFGGAMDSDEDAVTAALRETAEESTLRPDSVTVHGLITEDHGRWAYHTVLGTVATRIEVHPGSSETKEAAWVPVSTVESMNLFKPFANTWPRLRAGVQRPVIVVDCANVMGSRADGWWRDRKGAATRLRDQLNNLAKRGTTELSPFDRAFPEFVLVVEGQAKGIGQGATMIEVVDAKGEGDDTIVELVRYGDPDLRYLVVSADRELKARCTEAGAEILGPRWLLGQLT